MALALLAAFAIAPFFLLLVWPAVVGTAVLDLCAASLLFRPARRLVRRSGLSARTVLDTWLIAAPVAAACTAESIVLEWPIEGRSWDAHGSGMSGGEGNVLFFGPLHVLFWFALLSAAGRMARRYGQASTT
ncbi:MAG: hypothetical protein ACE5F1_17575 [Planctomycetota bacterium]